MNERATEKVRLNLQVSQELNRRERIRFWIVRAARLLAACPTAQSCTAGVTATSAIAAPGAARS